MSEPLSKTVALAGVASGAIAWFALAKQWTFDLFGVPLSVFLAAATGAFFARTFLPPSAFGRALAGWLGWTLIGGFGAELVRAALNALLSTPLPISAAAGCAVLVAGVGTVFVTADMVERLRAAIVRRIDRIANGGGNAP